MSVYVEVDGTDRSSGGVQHNNFSIDRGLQRVGVCRGVLQSRDASWRPSHYEALEVWEPARSISDAQIAAGSATLYSTAAVFTTADVQTHVRVAAAGMSGNPLRSVITAFITSTSVTLDDFATVTTTGAAGLVGRCRFFGYFSDVEESRIGGWAAGVNAGDRQFTFTARDKAGHLTEVYPVLERPEETLFQRIQALVEDGLDDHGITMSWPVVSDTVAMEDGTDFALEDGSVMALESYSAPGNLLMAASYDGQATAQAILDDLVVEDAAGRVHQVDSLARLRVTLPTVDTLPQTLTSTQLRNVSVRRVAKDYRNSQFIFYGPDGARTSAYSSDEIAAVGPIFGPPETNTAWSSDEADTRAAYLISLYATRTRYLLDGPETTVEGIQPGQTGTITATEHGVSGTHLIQSVKATYRTRQGSPSWLFTLTAASGTARVREDADYWRSA